MPPGLKKRFTSKKFKLTSSRKLSRSRKKKWSSWDRKDHPWTRDCHLWTTVSSSSKLWCNPRSSKKRSKLTCKLQLPFSSNSSNKMWSSKKKTREKWHHRHHRSSPVTMFSSNSNSKMYLSSSSQFRSKTLNQWRFLSNNSLKSAKKLSSNKSQPRTATMKEMLNKIKSSQKTIKTTPSLK